MRRFTLLLSVALLAVVAFSGAASAAVKVRAGVRPETIKQCGHGKAFVAIANTGERPIRIRISLALVNEDEGVVLGPFYGKLHLAAGERRMREFRFHIPGDFPTGNYAWVIRALASDETRDMARAPFVVVEGTCIGPADSGGTVIEDLGLEPDETPNRNDPSWGEIKRRYQN